jgi:hypothetical protein
MTSAISAIATRRPSFTSAPLLGVMLCGACAALSGCEASEEGSPAFGFGNSSGASSAGSSSAAGSSVGGTFVNGTGNVSGASFSPGGTPGATATGGGGSGGSTASVGGGGGTDAAGASVGGSSTEAGSGGGGGGPFVCGKAAGAAPLIDDFEDSNTAVTELDGRSGIWENFDDSSLTGSYVPRAPTALQGRNASVGYCVAVSGYSVWGANLVANLAAPKCGYDASAYQGVCFWAKGSLSGGGPLVFAVGTDDTVPEASGGKCTANCNAHYQLKLSGDSALADQYKEYCVEWAGLAPPTITQPKPLDAKAIVQLEWKFPAGAGVSTDGEICIDDVRFLE